MSRWRRLLRRVHRSPRRTRSINSQLMLMVVACLIPVLIGGAIWLCTAYTDRRAVLESLMLDTSEAVDLAVDRELGQYRDAAQVLATSMRLQELDLAGFYERAKRALADFPGSNIILADRTGQQLVNTHVPWGTPLPKRSDEESLRKVFATGKPTVSSLVRGAVSGRYAIGVDVPVFRGGEVMYDLTIGVPSERLSDMLAKTRLPTDWTAVLYDRNHVAVARSCDPGRFVGQRSLWSGAQSGPIIERGLASDGTVYVGAFTWSPFSEWSTAILVPEAVFTGEIWYWLKLELALVVMVLVVCGLAARMIAWRISGAVRELITPAVALGRGQLVAIPPLGISEVDDVAQSLLQASGLLQQREQERDNAERRMRETTEVLEATFDTVPVAIIKLSADGVITQWNRTAEQISGYATPKILGQPYDDDIAPKDAPWRPSEVLARLRRGEQLRNIRTQRLRPDGSVFDILISAVPIFDDEGRFAGAVSTSQDITETLRVEEHLRQAQKMEAIGNLTGGIAHDFNNLIGAAALSLQLQEDVIADNPSAIDLNRCSQEALGAAADLTQQLLAFARKQPLRPGRADVNELVSGIVRLLSRTLEETICIELALPPDVWPVLVDKAQFEAAIINLATNSRDAMPNGGRLIISTGNCHRKLAHEASPGDYVAVKIQDTGEGMASDVLARVFEPFFTTKDVGKGTGLGLSMVFGFARQSGGDITIDSTPGAGTVVTLYLPRANEVLEAPAARGRMPTVVEAGKCVLVVEDSSALRIATARHLRELGYKVLEAEHGAAALAVLESGTPVDVVFSDVVMPGGLSGTELVRIVRSRWPATGTVLTSGFSQARGKATSIDAGVTFLQKPYSVEDLGQVIARGNNSDRPHAAVEALR